jgi:hypothetical protein
MAQKGQNMIARRLLTLGLLLAWLAVPAASVAHADSTTFSGQATVVRATVSGLPPVVLSDTGPLPSSGGAQEASLLEASVPGLLTAQVLHASTVGHGNHSRSEASVANLGLTVAGNSIGADFLMARAEATCGPGGASASGSSEIVGLVINGQTVAVSGQPNQTVNLPPPTGGSVIINEQSSKGPGDITVTALHVIVPGTADVAVSSAHADITCVGSNCKSPNDFVTGGGWITGTPSGAKDTKDTFAVAGGIKNGGLWGHLQYIDHGSNLKVKGTGVAHYVIVDATTRHIDGTAEVNGVSGYTYSVDVADNGEPGRKDTFKLTLSNMSNKYSAGGLLDGGNIQLHNPC